MCSSVIIVFTKSVNRNCNAMYEFLSRIASSVLRVNCYQRGSCVGGPSAFNSPFEHGSRSHNICPLDNNLFGLSISLSSLVSAEYIDYHFSSLWYDSAVTQTATFRSFGELYLYTFTLPVGYQSIVFCVINLVLAIFAIFAIFFD